MSSSPSTPSGVRICQWLLLDPLNTLPWCHNIKLSDDQWQHMKVEQFLEIVLTAEVQKRFGFRPKLWTLRLWVHPLPWSHISPEWVAKNAKDFDPSGIATIPSDILITMNRFLGCGEPLKEPPEGQVHLIVTTRRLKRQQRREDEKERDALSDLRLMHRNYLTIIKGTGIPSSSIAAEPSQYARLQANPQTIIYDGFYNTRGCPYPDVGMRVTARDDKLEPMLRLSSGSL